MDVYSFKLYIFHNLPNLFHIIWKNLVIPNKSITFAKIYCNHVRNGTIHISVVDGRKWFDTLSIMYLSISFF